MKTKKENNQHVLTDCASFWEYCIDAQGKVTYVSPFWHSATGLLPDDILKNPLLVSKSLHPDDRPVYENHIKNAYDKKLPGDVEYRVVLPDGSIRWFSQACAPFFDEKGKYAGIKGRNWDITERKNIEHVITVQRDLGIALDKASSLRESLHLCLSAALNVSGLEAGGIYMLDQTTGELTLILASGHGDKFVKINSRLSPGSKPAQMIMAGRPFYLTCREIQDLQAADLLEEKMRSLAAIPFFDKGQVFGSLQVGSRIHNEIPVHSRNALETVARQISMAISRAQAEQNLRDSEEKYRALFENAVIGIFQITPDGKIISANPAMADMFGYDSLSSFMHGVTEIKQIYVNPDDWLSFQMEIERKGQVHKYEVPCLRKGGLEILVAVSARAHRDQRGHVISYHGFIEDITQPREMEDALRKSEERFRSLLKSSRDAILMMDPEGRVSYWNPAAERMFGYESAEAAGRNLHELIAPQQYLEEHRSAFAGYLRTGRGAAIGKTIELQATRKDGSEITVALSLSAERINDGWNAIGILRDITRQKEAESQREAALEALRESEEKFRVLVDSTPAAVLFYQDDHWIYANKAAEAICGYLAAELLSMNFWDIVHPDFKQILQKEGRNRQQGKETTNRHEFKIITKGGREKWVDLSGASTMLRGKLAGVLSVLDITERKKAEEEIREAHRRLDEIINDLPDATLVIDAEGKVIAWNRAIEQMTGIKAADMLGKGNYEYALPFYGERRPILIDLVLNPSEDVETEYVSTQRRDTVLEGEAYIPALRGGEAYLFVRASALKDSKGNVVGAIESIRDITARRRAEEKYQAIFENAVEGIFQSTPDGRILSVNPAMVKLSGYDSPEDLMQNVNNIIQFYANPDDRLSFRKEIEEKGTVKKYEVLCVRKDGEKIWIAVNARAIKDKEGHTIHYDGFFEDITERKKMESSLRKSEEQLRGIVDTSNAGIILMTIDGHILFANQQMGKMLGCPAKELIGTNYNTYVHPEDRGDVADNISHLKGGNVDQLYAQRRYICKDNIERWGYVSIGYIDVGYGNYNVVLVVSDITELKQVEKEKELLEDRLVQAQKMEAIGTLAGGVAHDFNNILASMMGYTEMAIKETRPKMRRDYLDQVLQACERAKNLVDQILAFSRRRELERYPVDLRPILQEALSLLRATLPATIEIKKDITQEETQVLADPTQIHQVIINLCTNAAHAMQEKGGLLEIHLSNIEILHPALAPYPDLPIGSYVRLSVRDTGHGIDDAIKDKIFDPFFTTKKTKEGTGLGLSAVYGIVKSSGGSIDVQSSVGEGATFTVFLPRTGSEGQVLEASQEEIDLQGHERILFVDDEEMLVKMTRLFFQNLGYRITATVSSPEALRLFQENPGAFDLVITDMTMPQTTGMELCRALLKIRPELPIILCTGYSDSINTAEARNLNIKELVLKPVSLNVLGRLVRRVLNG